MDAETKRISELMAGIGSVIAIVSTFMPWAEGQLLGTKIAKNGIEGDGIFIFIGCIMSLLVSASSHLGVINSHKVIKRTYFWVGTIGLTVMIVGLAEMASLSPFIQAGAGAYIATFGVLLVLVSSFMVPKSWKVDDIDE